MRNRQNGFTLAELLIVIIIIGILAAIAVPNILAWRRAVNETAAVARMKQVGEAQTFYYDSYGKRRYGALCFELKPIRTRRGPLVSDATAQFSADCSTSTPINEWIIYDNITAPGFDPAPLVSSFEVYARKPGDASAPIFCLFEDFLVRRGTASAGCTRTSPVIKD